MIELDLISRYPQEIIATDEVGRGPLCGPVVIGAVRVMIENKRDFVSFLSFLKDHQITDSKKISRAKRIHILNQLNIINLPFGEKGIINFANTSLEYVTWEMGPEVIDQENVLGASLRGMKEAALFLSDQKKYQTTVLIDGHKKFRGERVPSSWHEIPIIKGDSKSLLIGLSSIIAKEKRDLFMEKLDEDYPHYGLSKHFGYPTKEHRLAIEKFGPSPIHRKSFKGVKEYLRA